MSVHFYEKQWFCDALRVIKTLKVAPVQPQLPDLNCQTQTMAFLRILKWLLFLLSLMVAPNYLCLINFCHTFVIDTYTVTQAVNALGFGWFQVKLSLWTGLCWMADSMEMTILSILSPALHCDWHISRYQQALTTTVVFLGMMLSSTFWGNLSDRYGRKHVIK